MRVPSIRFADRLKALFGVRPAFDDEFFESVADDLVEGDIGPADALDLTDRLRAACRLEKLSDPDAVREKLAFLIRAGLKVADPALPGGLTVLLLLGVNGVGKTTSAAKLAAWQRERFGRKPLLAAADTFRAGAIEQLKIHGERLGMPVVAHKSGGDPAAVLFDAVDAAKARGCDLVIADTAGRMHTKSGLVEELKKIDRVVALKVEPANYRKFLVVDATTGRNAVAQAEIFHGAVRLDGAVLTKFDSTARGGIAYALERRLGIGITYVGSGERYADIAPFDPDGYAREFVGLGR
jgi:fused signal recognition particle receptor